MAAINLLRRLALRVAAAHRRGDQLLFSVLVPPFLALLAITWAALTVLAWLWPRRCAATVRLRSGIELRGEMADMVFMYAAVFGEWEPGVTMAVRWLVRRDSVFLDIGAHIGYYTLVAKTAGGGAVRTVSVEPAHANLGLLNANLARFSGPETHVLPVAVAAVDGPSTLFLGPVFNRGYTSLTYRPGLRAGREVRSVTLDRLLEALPFALGDVDLIKIDVEGSEVDILSDLVASSPDLRPDAVIIVEITASWVDSTKLLRVLAAFAREGYGFFRIRNAYCPLFYLTWAEPNEPFVPVDWRQLLEGKHDVAISRRRLDEVPPSVGPTTHTVEKRTGREAPTSRYDAVSRRQR